jgi:metal-responsive CopG/Arc/MetJ family transcriptional regulator
VAQVTSNISDELKARLRRVCLQRDTNQSQILRKILREYLDENEGNPKIEQEAEIVYDEDVDTNEKIKYIIKRKLESEHFE